METPRTAEGGHGVSATPARPGGRATPGSYPGPGLPEVLLARAASGMFLGQLLARCSRFLPMLTGPPAQRRGCVHSPRACPGSAVGPASVDGRPPCAAARPPHASGPGHPAIAIAGQDAIPAMQFPWLPALSAHASSGEAERLHSLSSS